MTWTIRFIALAVLGLVLMNPGRASAIPTLQLYIEGATYYGNGGNQQGDDTWVLDPVLNGVPFRLWAIYTPEGNVTAAEDVRLVAAHSSSETPTITLTPTRIDGDGTFETPGTDWTDAASEPGTGTPGTSGSGSHPELAPHGIYGAGTAWQEFNLGSFSAETDNVGDVQPSSPPTSTLPQATDMGLIKAYDVTVTGMSLDSWLHFDLYGTRVRQAGPNTIRQDTFAPFSHDVEVNVVPEPSPIVLGLATVVPIAAVGYVRRRRRAVVAAA